ncbi:glycosyltransferase [Ponticoccus gilvus]|nr:glycosyltransferase [Enemella evansiae]
MAPTAPHVTILLCTRNGAAYLPEQLQSYLDQDHRDWSLWVSDDGSDDATPAILEAFRAAHGAAHEIRLLKGPQRGSAANFLHLLCHPDLPQGHVALSDQDDVWLPEKLSRALARVEGVEAPALYAATSLRIDGAGRQTGRLRLPTAPPVFGSAMLQNVMPGHTMVMNPAGLALVRAVGPDTGTLHHDWWLSLLFTAAGARTLLDAVPVVLYRQHGGNEIGARGGLRAGLYRLRRVLARQYGDWVTAHARALLAAGPVTPASRAAAARFLDRPPQAGPGRVRRLWQLGLHRQSRAETAFVYLMAFLGRI